MIFGVESVLVITVFSHVHAILQPALSIGLSVRLLVVLSGLVFFCVLGGFGVTAPAQLVGQFHHYPCPTARDLVVSNLV